MARSPAPLRVEIPLETEVVALHRDLVKGASFEKGVGLVVDLDVRRRDWRKALGLESGTRVYWEDVRAVEVQELSSFLMPIRYRVTFGDGTYRDSSGERHRFGVEDRLGGLDLRRGVTTVTLRAAVLLAVLACVGLRSVSWLLRELFHVEASKSSLGRWILEAASQLPDAEGMARRLNQEKPIQEAHLDEVFPRGWGRGCVLVVKDEHGRLVATEEVAERTIESVAAFLRRLASFGLRLERFYVDGCEAYKKAIVQVFPRAAIQYDYFHVVQNIWRHLWKAMVRHRKEVKREAAAAVEPEERRRLAALAKRLWNHRGLMFKSDEHMTDDERRELCDLIAADPPVAVLRGFLDKVWGIFRSSKNELGARQRLGKLARRPEVQPDSCFEKAVSFLGERFDDMIAFLHVPGLKRNSLAESGIRCLRRLEQGHDGFRGSVGRDAFVRLYQAIRYCHWTVHRTDGALSLLPLPSATLDTG